MLVLLTWKRYNNKDYGCLKYEIINSNSGCMIYVDYMQYYADCYMMIYKFGGCHGTQDERNRRTQI